MPRKPSTVKRPRKSVKPKSKVKAKQPAPKSVQKQRPNISQCALDYIHTMVNPIDGPMGCVPGNLSMTSQKLRVCGRGQFFSGTSKMGFLICDPFSSVANDAFSIVGTLGGYTGTTIVNSSAANTFTAGCNSPYTKAQFADTSIGNESRVVGACVRIRYSGTVFDKGGTATLLHSPDGYSLIGSTVPQLGNEPQAEKIRLTDDWTTVWYYPTGIRDYEFYPTVFPDTATMSNGTYGFPMTIAVNTASESMPFDYEFWIVHEVIGRNVQGKTRSHADPNGLASAMTIMTAKRPAVGSIDKHERNVIDRFFEYVNSGITGVAGVAKTVAPLMALALA
jgi:hypothetical protein